MDEHLTVGEVARKAGVTPKTVRHYEDIGLLPEGARAPNGYRQFRIADVNRLVFIQRAKSLGLTLEDIRDLCAVAEDGNCAIIQSELQRILSVKIDECTERITKLERTRARMTAASERLSHVISADHHHDGESHDAFAPDCQCVPMIP